MGNRTCPSPIEDVTLVANRIKEFRADVIYTLASHANSRSFEEIIFTDPITGRLDDTTPQIGRVHPDNLDMLEACHILPFHMQASPTMTPGSFSSSHAGSAVQTPGKNRTTRIHPYPLPDRSTLCVYDQMKTEPMELSPQSPQSPAPADGAQTEKVAKDVKNHALRAIEKFTGENGALELVQGNEVNGTHNGFLLTSRAHAAFDRLRTWLELHVLPISGCLSD
jgi:HNH endonuclease